METSELKSESKISDFRLIGACRDDKHVPNRDADVLLPLISIVFKATNQKRESLAKLA